VWNLPWQSFPKQPPSSPGTFETGPEPRCQRAASRARAPASPPPHSRRGGDSGAPPRAPSGRSRARAAGCAGEPGKHQGYSQMTVLWRNAKPVPISSSQQHSPRGITRHYAYPPSIMPESCRLRVPLESAESRGAPHPPHHALELRRHHLQHFLGTSRTQRRSREGGRLR